MEVAGLMAMSVLIATVEHRAQGSSTCCVIPQHTPVHLQCHTTGHRETREKGDKTGGEQKQQTHNAEESTHHSPSTKLHTEHV